MSTRRVPTAAEWAFARDARVGRLATVAANGSPRVVPFCFAVLNDGELVVVSVIDDKPKGVGDRDLARVRNIGANPHVAFVVDTYAEDWSQLRFVQMCGVAAIIEPGDPIHEAAVAVLRAKYPQYRTMAIDHRPVIVIRAIRASSWRGDGNPFG